MTGGGGGVHEEGVEWVRATIVAGGRAEHEGGWVRV
jgi:hypothetical protein